MNEQLTIFHFDEIQSTNTWLYDKMAVGENIAGMVAVAGYQTAGRGMDKNRWESDAGNNLLFSIALDVSYLKAENQFEISQAVSVAIAECLEEVCGVKDIMVKWPNDIYHKDKKLAGILIQNTINGIMMGTTIIGIGLNVNQIEFSSYLVNPVSLKNITGKDYNLDKLLNKLVAHIVESVEALRFIDKTESLDSKYISRLYRYQRWADYKYNGQVKSMIIDGFDKYGRLLLHDREGADIICDVKEIQFCQPSCPPGSEEGV